MALTLTISSRHMLPLRLLLMLWIGIPHGIVVVVVVVVVVMVILQARLNAIVAVNLVTRGQERSPGLLLRPKGRFRSAVLFQKTPGDSSLIEICRKLDEVLQI
jgi:hypothetical protein